MTAINLKPRALIAPLVALVTSAATLAFSAPAHAAREPLFFCVSLEDDPQFDSITIMSGEKSYQFLGILRYVDPSGQWIEKEITLFRTRSATTGGVMIQFYGPLLQVRFFPDKSIGKEKFAANITMPELKLEFSPAACVGYPVPFL
jgi:hypothetical protein